eukprot:CAMPEP_0171882804 /NCGR_PEP_ID=MMETSP0992-20121227/39799_1 /TAXON_ID=483369 /ORGANISM="non described non described, Strain CCMP2098" /LENGTH=41 /DNA_ID= /DNA_START= /DNA_END= /DNA_ORIENTATION=
MSFSSCATAATSATRPRTGDHERATTNTARQVRGAPGGEWG